MGTVAVAAAAQTWGLGGCLNLATDPQRHQHHGGGRRAARAEAAMLLDMAGSAAATATALVARWAGAKTGNSFQRLSSRSTFSAAGCCNPSGRCARPCRQGAPGRPPTHEAVVSVEQVKGLKALAVDAFQGCAPWCVGRRRGSETMPTPAPAAQPAQSRSGSERWRASVLQASSPQTQGLRRIANFMLTARV